MDTTGTSSVSTATIGHLYRNNSARSVLDFLRSAPVGALAILVLLAVVAVLATTIAPHDATKADVAKSLIPPFRDGLASTYLLGTDQLGRDILSRLIFGSRISLVVAFVGVFLSGAMGTFLGLISGYFGGWLDIIVMRITDTILSIPQILVAIVLVATLGPSLVNVILVVGLINWTRYARVVRGEVLSTKQKDFVKLAIIAGCGPWRVQFVHVLPNIINLIIVLATLDLGRIIILEASLSFLGIGVPPPTPAWGLMLADGRSYLRTAWWLVTFPGLAIMLTVLAVNIVGDWLRDRWDPRRRIR